MPSEGGKPKGGALVQHERDKLKSAADDLSFFFFLHLDDRWIWEEKTTTKKKVSGKKIEREKLSLEKQVFE